MCGSASPEISAQTRARLRATAVALRYIGLEVLSRLCKLPLLGPWLHHPTGVLALAAGRPALAERALLAALETGCPWTPSIHHHLGKAQLALGRLTEAERSFARAATTQPGERRSRLWLAETLLRQDRAADGELLLRTLLAEGPDQSWPRRMLVHALLRQGRAAEAVDHLIATACRPGADLTEIPFPTYLLTPSVATAARAAALAPLTERHPDHRGLAVFQARLLSLLGDYAAATRLLRRSSGWASPGVVAAEAPKPPAFLIIGQAKAVNTALFEWLARHPDFVPPMIKEVEYWSRFPAAGLDWYLAHFPPVASRQVTGEASTSYLAQASVPAAAARTVPDARLICLLREPVSRAYSEYRMFQRLGWEQRSWDEAVEEELARLGGCPLNVADLNRHLVRGPGSYLMRSAVLPHLQRWAAQFPPERFLILQSTELFAKPSATIARVLHHVGLAPFDPGPVERVNTGYYAPMDPALAARLRDWFAPHQHALGTFLSRWQT